MGYTGSIVLMRPISAIDRMVRMGYLNVVPVGLNSAANHTGFPFRKLLPQIVLTPVEKHQIEKPVSSRQRTLWQTTARGRFVLIDDNGYGRDAAFRASATWGA